jgi:monoamine oxidase
LTGYSVPAPGEVTTIGRTLADPFGDRLFFAGEQACPGFFGYMEGALLSGVTAGRRIVQVLCPDAVPQVQTAWGADRIHVTWPPLRSPATG